MRHTKVILGRVVILTAYALISPILVSMFITEFIVEKTPVGDFLEKMNDWSNL